MMVLGIETSTALGSVAIVEDQKLRGERRWKAEKGHAERLIEELDSLLEKLSISMKALDGFAVTIGPGSFSGLRVGLATVKGLAMATQRPVIPVSTLEALARNVSGPLHPVCTLLDAQREEAYAALFRRDETGQWIRILPDQVIAPGDLLKQLSGPTIFVGEGAVLYQALIQQRMGEKASFAPPEAQWPSAAIVAQMGLSRLLRGETAQAKEIAPSYLRRPDAEVKLQKERHAAGGTLKAEHKRG
jgi:tRNA threonylcarbamoyladenosine biosynthesis protein TsaB